MKTLNTKIVVLIGFVLIMLSACDNASSFGNAPTINNGITKGVVVDPYIKDATFFWDKNKDGIRQLEEPISSKSDENGKFEFNLKIANGQRVVMKDKGFHNGVAYTGSLSANIGVNGIVSPLTTLEVKYPKSDILRMLAEADIIISKEDIHKDPMDIENRNEVLTTATIAVDAFLKIQNGNDVKTTKDTLKNIVKTTKRILDKNLTNENISRLVRVIDRLVSQVKEDRNLNELTRMTNNDTYSSNVKDALSDLSSSKASKVKDLGEDGNKITYKFIPLDNKVFSFDTSPVVGKSSTLSLDIKDSSEVDISWKVTDKPKNTTLNLVPSSDKSSVTFTALAKGSYTIEVTATSKTASSTKSTTFNAIEILREGKRGPSVDEDPEKEIGIIEDQSWVRSKTLDEDKLTAMVTQGKYDLLTKEGYDTTKGLLIKYKVNIASKTQLEKLKLESGIDNVYNRVYYNDKAFSGFAIYPKDTASFNDGGSNWHLETINMPEAWEYTTGSNKFLLGVSDAGYDTKHSDLNGRFASILTSRNHDHGMGVVGTMAANTDNGIGISGINWKTKVVVSDMGDAGVEGVITAQKDGKKVRLINNSWGYHLPTSFDPTNDKIAKARFDGLQRLYAHLRQVIIKYDNKLFFWAAGNGIGNGLGNTKGVYGVDAKYDNGVLHYRNGTLNKLNNLLIVAAFNERKNLLYYSEYGKSVDIAAPTGFKSLRLNNGYSRFGGTSAATPVVTAVASLIYSINPNLSAAEVKNILISSATEYVTKRQKNRNGVTEYLVHPLPILNAKEALKMAQKTIQKKVMVKAELVDILSPKLKLIYTPSSNDYKVLSVAINVKSSDIQDNYSDFKNGSSASNSIVTDLDKTKRYHRIDAQVRLKSISTGDTFLQNNVYDYSYSDLTIKTIDNITLSSLPSVEVKISKISSSMPDSIGTSDSSGLLKVYIDKGTYRLKGNLPKYSEGTKDIAVGEDLSTSTDLALTVKNDKVSQGSVAGFVYDNNGLPVANALVRISGKVYTNGYFASANTDNNGYYKITSIGKKASEDYNNTKIESYEMSVSKDGYVQTIREDVIILENQERTENFSLIKEIAIPDNEYIYKSNFEKGVADWNATGFWHQIDLNATNIKNTYLNSNIDIVSLAPNDNSNGRLPNALEGKKAFWYGQDSKGNYDSGKSYKLPVKNDGALISPLITIPKDINATLKFSTWWEIESVNPNSKGFDLLEIYVLTEDGTNSNICSNKETWWNKNKDEALKKANIPPSDFVFAKIIKEIAYKSNCGNSYELGTLLMKLNPAIDPAIGNREKIPFTSGGFNRKAIWNIEKLNLTKYAGQQIRIKFKFRSVDQFFNGFRGWMIDDFKIYDTSKINK
jgi:protocatechuate 3,4-dioxygenase beta subunit